LRLDAGRKLEEASRSILGEGAGPCRGRTCFGCSNLDGVPPKVYQNVVAMEQAVALCSINQQAWATLANSSALLSRRIHALLPAIMLASAARVPEYLPSCELMLHCTSAENETGW